MTRTAILLSLALSFSFLSIHAEPTNINNDDQFIASFAESMKNKKVIYKNGKLILKSDHSALATGFCGASSLFSLFLAYICMFPANDKPMEKSPFLSAFFSAGGIALGGLTIHRILTALKEQTYLVLNKKGLYVWGELALKWQNFNEIHTIITKYQSGAETDRTIALKDIYGTVRFSTGTHDEYLPISLDNFLVLVEHYKNKCL